MSLQRKIRILGLCAIACALIPHSAPAQNALGPANSGSDSTTASRQDLMPTDLPADRSASLGAASSWMAGQRSFGAGDKTAWGAGIAGESVKSASHSNWSAGRASFGYANQPGGLWVAKVPSGAGYGSDKGAKRAAAIENYILPSQSDLLSMPISPVSKKGQRSALSGAFGFHHSSEKSQLGRSKGQYSGAPLSFALRHPGSGKVRRSYAKGYGIEKRGRGEGMHISPTTEPIFNWKLDTGSSLDDSEGGHLKLHSGGGLQ